MLLIAGWLGSDAGERRGGAVDSLGDQGDGGPASAAAAARKALCIAAVNVAWLRWVMALAAWGQGAVGHCGYAD